MDTQRAAAMLEALGAPRRLEIYRTLVRAGEDGLPVGAIQRRLDIPASTLSHHLQRLLHVGLIAQERQGASLICRANYAEMDALLGYLTEACCAEARDADAA